LLIPDYKHCYQLQMKPVVSPLPREQVIAELTSDKLLRKTNNGGNEVYLFDNNSSPVLMQEVGRVREITFRHAGGGTGKEIDIDEFDNVPTQRVGTSTTYWGNLTSIPFLPLDFKWPPGATFLVST
jgi:hypothetical protein